MKGLAAVFLDRDGVINRNVFDQATGEYGAPRTSEQFELQPGAIGALQTLGLAGFPLFLVSNQPDFAKGKSTLEQLTAVDRRLRAELEAAGIVFAEFYYCFHHPRGVVAGYSGACECRKPSPYFLFKARDAYGLALERCWMVGDRASDIECGRAAGSRTIRVLEDHPAARAAGEAAADFEAQNLADAVEIILRSSTSRTP